MTFERAVEILKKYNEIRDKVNADLDEILELMTSEDFPEVHEYYGGVDDLDEEQIWR